MGSHIRAFNWHQDRWPWTGVRSNLGGISRDFAISEANNGIWSWLSQSQALTSLVSGYLSYHSWSHSSQSPIHIRTIWHSCQARWHSVYLLFLHHVHSLLTNAIATTVTCSIVTVRLDYCNAVLCCRPLATFDVLQAITFTAQYSHHYGATVVVMRRRQRWCGLSRFCEGIWHCLTQQNDE